jgi:large subunit ribosomal protein L29
MAILRIKEIRKMPREEREKRLNDLRAELTKLKTMIKSGGSVEKPARIKEIKRTIARILTVNNEEDRKSK